MTEQINKDFFGVPSHIFIQKADGSEPPQEIVCCDKPLSNAFKPSSHDGGNPFKRTLSCTCNFQIEDELHDAGLLTKSVLPYRSPIPYLIKQTLDRAFTSAHQWMIPDRFLPRLDVCKREIGYDIYINGEYVGPYSYSFYEQSVFLSFLRMWENEHCSYGAMLEAYLHKKITG